jgi:ethanolamine transporter EutH
VIGQFIFATIRSPLPRALMTVAFALPAAVAGYHLVLGLSAIGMASDPWRHVFAVIGAIMVGSTAWARLVAHPFEKPERAAGSGLQQS